MAGERASGQAVVQAGRVAEAETRRGRVRRLLIEPLVADGFRKAAKVDADRHRAFLDRVADSLGYMSDDGLRALRRTLATKGEGKTRDIWPCFAAILGHAEAFEKRPVEELPELMRWFASKAGPESLAAGRHVAEYEFWKRHKRPPGAPGEKARVAQTAEEMQAKAARFRQIIIERGALPWPQDRAWLDWYEAQEAYVRGLIEAGSAA